LHFFEAIFEHFIEAPGFIDSEIIMLSIFQPWEIAHGTDARGSIAPGYNVVTL